MRHGFSNLAAALLASVALAWAAPGETYDPELALGELPAAIAGQCPQDTGCRGDVPHAYTQRWLGQTPAGSLFMVARSACRGDCPVWIVRKGRRHAALLLTVHGGLRLFRGTGPYPVVEVESAVSDNETVYSDYEWRDGRYLQTDRRVLYRVDGVDCGTVLQCNRTALKAAKAHRYGRAVRIWEAVHSVPWI